jgi:hypothetical protein
MGIDELPDASGEKVDHMEKAISAKAKFAGGERKSSSEASSNKPNRRKGGNLVLAVPPTGLPPRRMTLWSTMKSYASCH